MDWERLRRLIKTKAVAVCLDAPEWEWQNFRNGNGSKHAAMHRIGAIGQEALNATGSDSKVLILAQYVSFPSW